MQTPNQWDNNMIFYLSTQQLFTDWSNKSLNVISAQIYPLQCIGLPFILLYFPVPYLPHPGVSLDFKDIASLLF